MLLLRTLGALALDGPDLPSGFALQRSRLALLAAVAASGDGGISRDRLLALFWPEADTERARGSLKQAVYVLRRDLGEDLFLTSEDLRLNPVRISSDISEFDAAVRASDWRRVVALYRGPFLPGVHLGSGEFARWRDDEARRMAVRYHRALEVLATAAEGDGAQTEALEWWRSLSAAEPLNAPVTLSLMRALVRAGNPTAALQHAALHSQLVRSDLDADPDPAVKRLTEQIRRDIEEGCLAPTKTPAPRTPPPTLDTDSPTSTPALGLPPAPSLPAWRRTRWGLGLLSAAAVAFLFAARGPDADLVRIDIVRSGSTAAQSALEEHLTMQVLNRMPDLRIRAPWGRTAQYRISATVRTDRDSLHFTAVLTERDGRRMRSPDAVVVATASAGDGMRRLGDQTAIAIAAARSRLFATWAPAAAIPETWQGFLALEAALREWTPPEPGGGRDLFAEAAALDPSSGTPLVLRAMALTKSSRAAASDSVLRVIAASSRRLGPWDRAMIDVLGAWNRGNLAEGHAASHRLLELVPDSEWALVAAYGAIHVGRGRETLELLRRVPVDVAWTRKWADIIRNQALMLTGDYAAALADAEERLRVEPENRIFVQFAVKALAALGRTEEVEAACTRSLAVRLQNQPCLQAVIELRGFGHAEAARRVVRRFLGAMKAADTTASEYTLARINLAYSAGDWAEFTLALSELPPAVVNTDPDLLGFRALSAAADGDRATARRLLSRLHRDDWQTRAEVAALLGDTDEAVALLAHAFQSGVSRSHSLNRFPAFDRLRGHPKYESLVAAVDSPEHRAQVAVR